VKKKGARARAPVSGYAGETTQKYDYRLEDEAMASHFEDEDPTIKECGAYAPLAGSLGHQTLLSGL
jgi:hypothetical protein